MEKYPHRSQGKTQWEWTPLQGDPPQLEVPRPGGCLTSPRRGEEDQDLRGVTDSAGDLGQIGGKDVQIMEERKKQSADDQVASIQQEFPAYKEVAERADSKCLSVERQRDNLTNFWQQKFENWMAVFEARLSKETDMSQQLRLDQERIIAADQMKLVEHEARYSLEVMALASRVEELENELRLLHMSHSSPAAATAGRNQALTPLSSSPSLPAAPPVGKRKLAKGSESTTKDGVSTPDRRQRYSSGAMSSSPMQDELLQSDQRSSPSSTTLQCPTEYISLLDSDEATTKLDGALEGIVHSNVANHEAEVANQRLSEQNQLLKLLKAVIRNLPDEKQNQEERRHQVFVGDQTKLPPPQEYLTTTGEMRFHQADCLDKSEEEVLDSFRHPTDFSQWPAEAQQPEKQFFGLTKRPEAHCKYTSMEEYYVRIFEKQFQQNIPEFPIFSTFREKFNYPPSTMGGSPSETLHLRNMPLPFYYKAQNETLHGFRRWTERVLRYMQAQGTAAYSWRSVFLSWVSIESEVRFRAIMEKYDDCSLEWLIFLYARAIMASVDAETVESDLRRMRWDQSQSLESFVQSIRTKLEFINMLDPFDWESQLKGGEAFLRGVPVEMAHQIHVDLQNRNKSRTLEAVFEQGRRFLWDQQHFARLLQDHQHRQASQVGSGGFSAIYQPPHRQLHNNPGSRRLLQQPLHNNNNPAPIDVWRDR